MRESAKYALKQIKNSPAYNSVPVNLIPQIESLKSGTYNSDVPDPVITFLNASHPRPLNGPWQSGWSLGFHSRFVGGDWARSGIGDLTYRLKYEGDLSVLPALVAQTIELTRSYPELTHVDVILPVPSSQPRETEPVQAFCNALSEKIRIPEQSLLFKTRQTQPQKELKTLSQKWANVDGAFGIRDNVSGKRILVVDDLYDSGATLEEITHLLLRRGAACVNVFTLTRTIHSDL